MKIFILTLIILKIIFKNYLTIKQIIYIYKRKEKIPAIFQDRIDLDKLKKSNSYNLEKLKFSIFSSNFSDVILILFIFTPLFGIFSKYFSSLSLNYLLESLLFFSSLIFLNFLLTLPFDFYFNFKIEKKFNFSNYNFKNWSFDKIKELFISLVIVNIITGFIILITGEKFVFSPIRIISIILITSILLIFFQYILPIVIIPFMYKMKRLDDTILSENIKNLIEKSGYTFDGVYVIKESEKSSHSNAMFTGLGNKKRVIIFDNLLKKFSNDEILGIIGHEIGHGKLKHVLNFLFISIILSSIFIILSFIILSKDFFYDIFNIPNIAFSGLFLLYFLTSEIVLFFFNPLLNHISRKFEYDADRFSKKILNSPDPLIKSFKKFASEELVSLQVDPFYEFFYYSHPDLEKRIERLLKV